MVIIDQYLKTLHTTMTDNKIRKIIHKFKILKPTSLTETLKTIHKAIVESIISHLSEEIHLKQLNVMQRGIIKIIL